jgi:YcaO-like protein with predicted kinase domain
MGYETSGAIKLRTSESQRFARKDASPGETVYRIRAILDSVGFHRDKEVLLTKRRVGDYCYSCHLRYEDYPILFSNGKGLTEELALASAFAEFIERLQCFMDAFFTRVGFMHAFPFFSGSVLKGVDEFGDALPELMEAGLAKVRSHQGPRFECIPFLEVSTGSTVYLPYHLLTLITSSNGMAAGNTPAEAISQGICEVFERYVLHALIDDSISGLPTLSLTDVSIGNPALRGLVDAIQENGIEIIIKDGTMGGALPVLGVVLVHRETNTCGVSFGADPVFDVALSRCLTEAFQGIDKLHHPLHGRKKDDDPLDLYNNLYALADKLLSSEGDPRWKDVFISASDNGEIVGFLMEKTKRLGHRLYIRDFSLLGFPSYYVYIDGMSPLRKLPEFGRDHLYGELEKVKRGIFNLDSISEDECTRCGNLLYEELTSSSKLLELYFAQKLLNAPVWYWTGLRPLLVFMLIRGGEYEKAFKVLTLPPAAMQEEGLHYPTTDSSKPMREVLTLYCELKAKGLEDADVLRRLTEVFDQSIFREGLRDLMEKNFGAFVWNSGKKIRGSFTGLHVPRCLSVYNCPSCLCRKYCYVEKWYKIARSLRQRVMPGGQEELKTHLARFSPG